MDSNFFKVEMLFKLPRVNRPLTFTTLDQTIRFNNQLREIGDQLKGSIFGVPTGVELTKFKPCCVHFRAAAFLYCRLRDGYVLSYGAPSICCQLFDQDCTLKIRSMIEFESFLVDE